MTKLAVLIFATAVALLGFVMPAIAMPSSFVEIRPEIIAAPNTAYLNESHAAGGVVGGTYLLPAIAATVHFKKDVFSPVESSFLKATTLSLGLRFSPLEASAVTLRPFLGIEIGREWSRGKVAVMNYATGRIVRYEEHSHIINTRFNAEAGLEARLSREVGVLGSLSLAYADTEHQRQQVYPGDYYSNYVLSWPPRALLALSLGLSLHLPSPGH